MKFFEMIQKTTIVQRILISVSTIWLLIMINGNWSCRSYQSKMNCHFDIGDFALGLIPIVVVWGLYWIIIEIVRKRKNK